MNTFDYVCTPFDATVTVNGIAHTESVAFSAEITVQGDQLMAYSFSAGSMSGSSATDAWTQIAPGHYLFGQGGDITLTGSGAVIDFAQSYHNASVQMEFKDGGAYVASFGPGGGGVNSYTAGGAGSWVQAPEMAPGGLLGALLLLGFGLAVLRGRRLDA